MVRTADSGEPPMTITTRDVLVRPAERYAETAAPMRAVTPQGEFRRSACAPGWIRSDWNCFPK
jgi:lipopolysaccharide export system protein LptC